MAVKVKVNPDACIGCGLCAATYVDVFTLNDNGQAEVIGDIDDSVVDEAVANCPAGAIEKE